MFFNGITQKLTNPLVHAFADFCKPPILNIDAFWAVLYQLQNGIERVICYASRGLRSSEKLYLAHLLKFLYLKMAITDKLHDYLNGNQLFEVRTKTTRSRMSQLHVRQIATGSLVIRAYYLIYVEDLQLT